MSGSGGGLRDLAAWALRGGAGRNDDEAQQQAASATAETATPETPMTAEELRAQRLARMEELRMRRLQQQDQQMDVATTTQQSRDDPMDVDGPPKQKNESTKMPTEV